MERKADVRPPFELSDEEAASGWMSSRRVKAALGFGNIDSVRQLAIRRPRWKTKRAGIVKLYRVEDILAEVEARKREEEAPAAG